MPVVVYVSAANLGAARAAAEEALSQARIENKELLARVAELEGAPAAREHAARQRQLEGAQSRLTSAEAAGQALNALGATRIALVSPYSDEVIGRAKDYYERNAGLEVVAMEGFGATDAYAIGALNESHALEAFSRVDGPAIEALVVPGGNFPTMRHIAGWEARFGKPVITTNQVVLWSVMRAMGVKEPIAGLGRLLSELPT